MNDATDCSLPACRSFRRLPSIRSFDRRCVARSDCCDIAAAQPSGTAEEFVYVRLSSLTRIALGPPDFRLEILTYTARRLPAGPFSGRVGRHVSEQTAMIERRSENGLFGSEGTQPEPALPELPVLAPSVGPPIALRLE